MECKKSLVCARYMSRTHAVHFVWFKCENSSRCTPQQVHARSAHNSDILHLLRASWFLPNVKNSGPLMKGKQFCPPPPGRGKDHHPAIKIRRLCRKHQKKNLIPSLTSSNHKSPVFLYLYYMSWIL